jgi:hypothetical protein
MAVNEDLNVDGVTESTSGALLSFFSCCEGLALFLLYTGEIYGREAALFEVLGEA